MGKPSGMWLLEKQDRVEKIKADLRGFLQIWNGLNVFRIGSNYNHVL
jgi:hypothetical protein